MQSKNGGLVGAVDSINWLAGKQLDDGLVVITLSVKFKEVLANTRAKVTDDFTIAIEGKPTGGRFNSTSEIIQKVRIHVVEGEKAPEFFEDNVIYQFSGVMLVDSDNEDKPGRVAAAFRGGANAGTKR